VLVFHVKTWLWEISCERECLEVRPVNVSSSEGYETHCKDVSMYTRSNTRRCRKSRIGGIVKEDRRTGK
jgi:hypothetical protein